MTNRYHMPAITVESNAFCIVTYTPFVFETMQPRCTGKPVIRSKSMKHPHTQKYHGNCAYLRQRWPALPRNSNYDALADQAQEPPPDAIRLGVRSLVRPLPEAQHRQSTSPPHSHATTFQSRALTPTFSDHPATRLWCQAQAPSTEQSGRSHMSIL